jgi:ankyrin repeat protein
MISNNPPRTAAALEEDLREAAYQGNLLKVKELLEKGVDFKKTGLFQDTALHNAAQQGHAAVCEELIKAGSDLEAPDKSLKTPLHWACENGHVDACRALLDGGANIQAEVTAGATSLHLAAQGKKTEVCMLLISKGASTHCKSKNATAAAMAKRYGHPDLADQIRAMAKSKKAMDAMEGVLRSVPMKAAQAT